MSPSQTMAAADPPTQKAAPTRARSAPPANQVRPRQKSQPPPARYEPPAASPGKPTPFELAGFEDPATWDLLPSEGEGDETRIMGDLPKDLFDVPELREHNRKAASAPPSSNAAWPPDSDETRAGFAPLAPSPFDDLDVTHRRDDRKRSRPAPAPMASSPWSEPSASKEPPSSNWEPAPRTQSPETVPFVPPAEPRGRPQRPDIDFGRNSPPSESTVVMDNAPARTNMRSTQPIPAVREPAPQQKAPPAARQMAFPPPATRIATTRARAPSAPSLDALMPKQKQRSERPNEHRPREIEHVHSPAGVPEGAFPPVQGRAPSGRPPGPGDRADSDILRAIPNMPMPGYAPQQAGRPGSGRPPKNTAPLQGGSQPPPPHHASGYPGAPHSMPPAMAAPQPSYAPPPVARVAAFSRPPSAPPPKNVRSQPPTAAANARSTSLRPTTKTKSPGALGLVIFAAPLVFATALVAALAFF